MSRVGSQAEVRDLRTTTLGQLPEGQLRRLVSLGAVERIPARHMLLQEGDQADRVYVLLEGQLRVCTSSGSNERVGERVELRTLGPGEVFGELALLEGGRRSASVEALEESTVFALDPASFRDLLHESPELLSGVLGNLAQYVRTNTERLVRNELEQRALRAEMEVERLRSLTQMVAGVAHELNTPLGIVQTASSIIRQRLASGDLDDVQEAATLLEANVERAHRLVQSFKQVAADTLTDPLERVSLLEVVQETVQLFTINAREAGMEVAVISELDDPMWVGYRGYLGQVVFNLLTNIERYAYPNGTGGRVEIRLDAIDAGFRLTVQDWGSGIPPDSLSHVWEPFFTTGRAQGGTGLGLAIVRNIVNSRLGGEVDLTSEAGQGTTVSVHLPQVTPERRS